MASMTNSERVDKYFKRILNSKDKLSEINEIINEIENLIYTESKKPLSENDKEKLYSGLIERFERITQISEEHDFSRGIESFRRDSRIVSSTDNTEMLKIISVIQAKKNNK